MTESTPAIRPVEWRDGKVRLLDQTRLPGAEVYLETDDYRVLADAIREMRVRGAPAIGITAAYGVVLAAQASRAGAKTALIDDLDRAIAVLAATRPTAINLFWALNRMRRVAQAAADAVSARAALQEEAQRIHEEAVAGERRMADLGAALLPAQATVLTHCNAGALATGGYGTALGVIRSGYEQGKVVGVYADETRPLLQGARLTAWELGRSGVPVTVIVDGAAAALMAQGRLSCVLVGADRIAANGDTANKIGTYGLAVLAHAHSLPFYVVAPVSTIDLTVASGDAIPIEERSAEEVRQVGGTLLVPDGAAVYNPAFDVTPHHYITAIITDQGVAYPPYEENLRRLCRAPMMEAQVLRQT